MAADQYFKKYLLSYTNMYACIHTYIVDLLEATKNTLCVNYQG